MVAGSIDGYRPEVAVRDGAAEHRDDARAEELNNLRLALATFTLQLDVFEMRVNGAFRAGMPPETRTRRLTSVAGVRGKTCLAVNKVTWQQVGRVTEPGRYMFRFGWLTITAQDLAVWERLPNAAFTLVRTTVETDLGDEFRRARR